MAMIGSSILDIGTSKWATDDSVERVHTSLAPTHFMLPSVANVSLGTLQNHLRNISTPTARGILPHKFFCGKGPGL